ncbi:MAG TPA: hypothetical protein VFE57_05535 [Cyclobacteriaceae bacterium]|jgi:hypothetical protein|nr:hypothetical protein [Cyclobacteriaceae bacterium]
MYKALLIFILFTSSPTAPADVAGQWKGNVSGQFDITVFFEVNGDKLTAKVQSQIGETVFTDGRIAGDDLLFTDQSFNGITIASLKGKVEGETINFTVNFQGQDMKGVLNKVK